MLIRLASQSKPSIHGGLLAGDEKEKEEKEGNHNNTGVRSPPRVFGREGPGSRRTCWSPHSLLPQLGENWY